MFLPSFPLPPSLCQLFLSVFTFSLNQHPYIVLLLVFTGTGIVHRLFEIISPARASFIVFRMNERRLQRSLFLRPQCLAFYDRFLSRFDRLVAFNSLCVAIVCFSHFHPSRCLPSSAFLSPFIPLGVRKRARP